MGVAPGPGLRIDHGGRGCAVRVPAVDGVWSISRASAGERGQHTLGERMNRLADGTSYVGRLGQIA